MTWDGTTLRGCGLVVLCLRDYWFYACLVALRSEPMSPAELLRLFESVHDANVTIFGEHGAYPRSVTRHLRPLARARLVEAGSLEGRERRYVTTRLGVEMLDSLSDAGRFGLDRYEWLVRSGREERRIRVDAPIPQPDPDDSDAVALERMRRRALALLFGVVLSPKWSFSVLAALTRSPLRFHRIIHVANAGVAPCRDVVSGHLVDSVLATRLDTLQRQGLVERIPAEIGRRDVYALTDDGRALMAALEPVARFGADHDVEMSAAVRAM